MIRDVWFPFGIEAHLNVETCLDRDGANSVVSGISLMPPLSAIGGGM